MKRYIQVISLLCFLVAAFFVAQNNVTIETTEVTASIDEKAIIAKPALVAGVNATMPDFATVKTVELSQNGATISLAAIESEFPKSIEATMYATTVVNIREEASIDSKKIGKTTTGTGLYVVNQVSEEWYEAMYKDKIAYIHADYLQTEPILVKVSSTAYWNKYNRTSASGRELVAGKSVAGRVSWIHKYVDVYACNKDGSVGEYLGEYRFDDTGYGQESGVGESKILKGRTIGTIENGTCIDFYFDTEAECFAYGRRDVYIAVKED